MKNNKLKRGFTLIELLVVIAIIAILAAIVIFAVGRARLKAKDAAVMTSMASYRNTIELEFAGDYDDLCDSDSYYAMEAYVEEKGGEMLTCQGEGQDYVLIATLPSGNESSLSYFAETAYAQFSLEDNVAPLETSYSHSTGIGALQTGLGNKTLSENKSSFCINSHGTSSKISLADYVRLQGISRDFSYSYMLKNRSNSAAIKSFQSTAVLSDGMVLGDSTGPEDNKLAQFTSEGNYSILSHTSTALLDASSNTVTPMGRFMTSSFCTADDLAKAMGVDVSEVNSYLEEMRLEDSYSKQYEYECEEDDDGYNTGGKLCYDYDEDDYVDVSVCDSNNAYPATCEVQEHYSDQYEYECEEDDDGYQTGVKLCYDYDEDDYVDVSVCDSNNAYPTTCEQ